MRVNKRTAMHNIFDSACLKGYSFPFRIRSVHHCKRRRWEAARLDVQHCVCIMLTFGFLSVTVSHNVYKTQRCGMQSSKLMEGSSEVISVCECVCVVRVSAYVRESQSAELHLLVNHHPNTIYTFHCETWKKNQADLGN